MRRGTSLLELVVVLVVTGVLLALAAPRLATLRDGASVRAAAGDLGALFSLARETAITRRTTVAVVLDTTTGSVSVRAADATIVRHDLGTVYGVSVASARDSAAYDARGLGYGVSNLSVILRRGRYADTLTMSRMGRVRW